MCCAGGWHAHVHPARTQGRRSAPRSCRHVARRVAPSPQTTTLGEPLPQEPSQSETFAAFLVFPVVGWFGFPWLVEAFRATRAEQWFWALVIGKRAFLCLMATSAVSYAGKRAAATSCQPLGERFQALNEDILDQRAPQTPAPSSAGVPAAPTAPSSTPEGGSGPSPGPTEPGRNASDSDSSASSSKTKGLYKELDNVKGRTQALALPFLLAGSLVVSYAVLMITTHNAGPLSLPKTFSVTISKQQVEALVLLSNVCVVLLFSATEFRAIARGVWKAVHRSKTTSGVDVSSSAVPPQSWLAAANLVALACSAAAFCLPLSESWPVQNVLNISVAVTVARAIAQSELRTIALLLVGVAFYDFVGVFATAVLIGSASGVGAMGAVAIGKLGSGAAAVGKAAGAGLGAVGAGAAAAATPAPVLPAWRPGLLEVVLAGRVSDALGLADVVFPAVLVAWAARRDAARGTGAYLVPCICGYVLGCVACEFSPVIGQAALVFIVPAMLAAVSVAAWTRNELGDVWRSDAAP